MERVNIFSGETIDVNIFVLLLSYSRFRVYRVSLSKSQNILFSFLDDAFEIFGGVPEEIVTDNMKTELENIVKTTEYKNIKKSIFDNPIYSEIMTTVLSLLLPIAILALIVFFITNSAKRKKKKH